MSVDANGSRIEFEDDSDDDFAYEEVDVDIDDDDLEEGDDLETALIKVRQQQQVEHDQNAPKATVGKRPELIDDFIRNFLLKMKMFKTLDVFQTEWYEKSTAGLLTPEDVGVVADVYQRNQELDNTVKSLRAELDKAKEIAHKARSTWDKFRKERDFHRMNHRRVVQEKSKLVNDLRRLRGHLDTYEPTLQGLDAKYQIAMKEKAMANLKADKMATKMDTLEKQLQQATIAAGASMTRYGDVSGAGAAQPKGGGDVANEASKVSVRSVAPKATMRSTQGGPGTLASDTSLAAFQDRENPYLSMSFEPQRAETYELKKSFKAHIAPISTLAMHPKKSILATASDDNTWKMWSVPGGELILTGEGHKSWVSSIDFHPRASSIATGSGDSTVKLWDFAKSKCMATLTDHSQAVWGVCYHDSGDYLASCSMDHTAKLWDVSQGRCRQTFRGHVDSINSVTFQPFSNSLCTCSGDKTVSLWDARTGLCIQTFYGHLNAVNHVAFNLKGDTIASTDADGGLRMWDVRMVLERMQINAGPHSANKVEFDRSGQILALASDDHTVKIFDALQGALLGTLEGHEEAVQAVIFDGNSQALISAGSDNSFRVWG